VCIKLNSILVARRKEKELEIDWESKAKELWKLLEDIDTASDVFKPE
jgi:hypothetical protein